MTPLVIHVGDTNVALPTNGHIITIDQALTYDELTRLARALEAAGDPTGRMVHTVELHPIIGECARAIVHRFTDQRHETDGLVTELLEVRA